MQTSKQKAVYQSAKSSIKKKKTTDLVVNRRLLFSHICEGCKSTIKGTENSVSGESSLPDLQMDASHCVFTQTLLYVHGGRQRQRQRDMVSLSFFRRTPKFLSQGPILIISFNLSYLFKVSFSKYSHFGSYSFNTRIQGSQIQSMTTFIGNCKGPHY